MTPCIRRSCHMLLWCAAVGAAAPLHAADPAPKKSNILAINGGKPTGKLLTRDQLRSCLKQQANLKEQSAETVKAQSAIDLDKAEIARLDGELARADDALQAERATVDATNAAAVEAFNAKLHQNTAQREQRNRRAADFNAKLPVYNQQVETLHAAEQAWKVDCGDKSYDEIDFFAIQRGK